MKNEKQRQTYYGALNSQTGKVIMKAYPQGNTANTIKFIDSLKVEYPNTKLVIIWDGVPYHHSQEFREYLHQVNSGEIEKEWMIKCIKLAPNAPEQNPIEDVWLQGKNQIGRAHV